MENAPYRVEKKIRKGRNIAKLIIGYLALFASVLILANVLNSNSTLKQSQTFQNTNLITNIQIFAATAFLFCALFMIISFWITKSNIGNIIVISTSIISLIAFGSIIKLYPVTFYIQAILILTIIYIIIISKKVKN
jgi:hypothetical protein